MRSKFVTELGDVTIIKALEFAKTFNPDQLRDDSGKWTAGGGSPLTFKDLTPGEKSTFDALTSSPSWQEAVAALRTGTEMPQYKKDFIANMDSIIAKSPTLSEPMTTYRGVTAGSFADNLKSLAVGDTFTDKGFSSTSTDPAIANKFAGFFGPGGVTLTVDNPAGTQGANVYEIKQNFVTNEEREWLLPRNTTFQVTSNSNDTIGVKVLHG